MDTLIDHDRLADAVADAGLAVDTSELHGLLAGYLCGGGHMDRNNVLATLQLENEDTQLDALMAQLHDACRANLSDLEMGLEPLLPADDSPLRQRTDALVAWTRGFMAGFGLAGGASDALTDDGKEVLRDLGTIGGSDLTLDEEADDNEPDDDSGDATDSDESAQMELVEYVRVGAMLLHSELGSADADNAPE